MSSERSEGISRRRFLQGLRDLGFLATAMALPRLPELGSTQSEWEEFLPGDQAYGLSLGPTRLYSQPDISSPVFSNRILGESDNPLVHTPRRMIEADTALRIMVVNSDWAKLVLPPGNLPFSGADDSGHIPKALYIPLEQLSPVKQMEPISVLSSTRPIDKEIVVFHQPSPRLILVEQGEIVAHIPVVLGDYKGATPYGEHHVWVANPCVNMSGYPGVAFCLEIKLDTGVFLHNAPWWVWSQISEGFYGSHGCINLPSSEWHNATIAGKKVSMAQFIFQWALTNFGEFDQASLEPAYSSPRDNVNPLPVHILNTADEFGGVPRANSSLGWGDIINGVARLGRTDWIIPKV